MAIYVVLAILIWLTMDASSVPVGSGKISLRGVTLVLIGFFAARTVLHWRADKIRAERDE